MEWCIYKILVIDLLKNMILLIDQKTSGILAQIKIPENHTPILLEYNREQQKACLITKHENNGSVFIINLTNYKLYRLPVDFPAPLQCTVAPDFQTIYFIDQTAVLQRLNMTTLTIAPIAQPDNATCVGIVYSNHKIYTAWEAKENGSVAVFKPDGEFILEYQLEAIPTNLSIHHEKLLVTYTESKLHGEGLAIFKEDALPIYLSFQPAETAKALHAYPCNIAIDSASNHAYIINEDSCSITVIDLNIDQIIGAFPLGRSITNLYLLPNPKFAIATSNMFADLSVIDLINQRLLSISNSNCEFANMLSVLA